MKKKRTVRESYIPREERFDFKPAVRHPDTPFCNIALTSRISHFHGDSAAECTKAQEEARELFEAVLKEFGHVSFDGSLRRGAPTVWTVTITIPLGAFHNADFLGQLRCLSDASRRRKPLPGLHGEPWRLVCDSHPDFPNGQFSRLEFEDGRFFFRGVRNMWEGKVNPRPILVALLRHRRNRPPMVRYG